MNNTKLLIEITMDTLSMLLAGLFYSANNVAIEAIPASTFVELAEKLYPYLNQWDYTACSFEDWVTKFLLICPKVLVSPEEQLAFQKDNEIYFERWEGNAILVVTAPVVVTKPEPTPLQIP